MVSVSSCDTFMMPPLDNVAVGSCLSLYLDYCKLSTRYTWRLSTVTRMPLVMKFIEWMPEGCSMMKSLTIC